MHDERNGSSFYLKRLRARAYFIRKRSTRERETHGGLLRPQYVPRAPVAHIVVECILHIFEPASEPTDRQRGERIKPTSFTSLESGQRSQNGKSCLLFLRNGVLGRGKCEGDAGNKNKEVMCKGWVRRWSEVEGTRDSIYSSGN